MLARSLATAFLLAAVVLLGLPLHSTAAPVNARVPVAPADTTDDPNEVPYATDRGVGYHALKLPAYVLHGATRPLGWAVKYVEREFPGLFVPQRPPRGVVPLIELGGPVGISGGLALYDNALFGSSHKARVEGVYGARNFYEVEGRYDVPNPVGERSSFVLEGNFSTNPRNRFFLGGRQSQAYEDEVEFYIQQFEGGPELAYALGDAMRLRHWVQYRYVEATPADSRLGDRFSDRAPGAPGLGTQHTLEVRTAWTLDTRRRERSRPTSGTLLRLGGAYTHDLESVQFRYGRYAAEVQQYLPVPGPLPARRLVLRSRLEQVEPMLSGKAVPFYAQPTLGSPEALRGFIPNRFASNGALVVNAEYRYPIWDLWDAVVFVDAGQVFRELEDVNVADFEVSYGGGIHLLSPKGLNFRFEVAGSTEGARVILTVDPAFRSLF
jgi:hypothetical protein